MEVVVIAEKGINFKVDAEIYRKVKIKVAEEGTNIKEYMTNLILKDLEEKKE